MGRQTRIFDGLYSHFRWIGECVEVSVHRVREWRWRLSNTLYRSPTSCWKTILSSRGTSGTVYQQIMWKNMVHGAGYEG